MKLLLDTNILFSAISKKEGMIAEIILNKKSDHIFYGSYFSYIELFKYKEKLLQASKLTEPELLEALYLILKRVIFINDFSISQKDFDTAFDLVKDIDAKDTIFIAMNNFLKTILWTGDTKLVTGLRNKGYKRIITTNELLLKMQ
ncbi:MAG: DNA-binding protein [Bacteroidetes bacterium]|nr:DNA-binding protein [Bacteroidota bacterium]